MRILYVEDHADTARVLSRLLSQHEGYVVTVAPTLAEARRQCETCPFDLLICDLGLPDGDGLDLAPLAARCGIKAIALSGYGYEEDVARSLEAGFAAHLVKPVSLDRVLSAIADVARPRPDPSPAVPA